MRMTLPARAAALLLLLLLPLIAGCGNKVTAPGAGVDQQTADDLALQAATSLALTGGDIQFAVSSSTFAAQTGARQATPARALWDTTIVWNGITYVATRTFYDALDNALPAWDPAAVRLRWTSRAYGTYEGLRDTASVGHEAELDIRGLEAAEDTLTFDGVCRDTLENRFRSLDGLRTRYFYWVSSATARKVDRLKNAGPVDGWPLGGTMTFTVSADRLRSNARADVEAHFDATVVVTFNGTSTPDLVVDGTWHYRWNMLTGAVTRA